MNQQSVDSYYAGQASGGYYSAPMFQQGHGLGGLFSSLFRAMAPVARAVAPVLRRGARSVGYELLRSGADIANDIADGSDLRTATKKGATQFGSRLGKNLKKGAVAVKRQYNRSSDQRRYINKKKRGAVNDIFDD
jgi:hypothetical protein